MSDHPWELAGAIAAVEKVTVDTLNVECRRLIGEIAHLNDKLAASQLVAAGAIKQCTTLSSRADRAEGEARILRRERDEWHRLAVESDREAAALKASCNGKHWIVAPDDSGWEEAATDG